MESLMNRPAPVNATVRIRPGKRDSLRQLLYLQQVAFDTIRFLKEDVVRSEDVALRARTGSSIAQWAYADEACNAAMRAKRGQK